MLFAWITVRETPTEYPKSLIMTSKGKYFIQQSLSVYLFVFSSFIKSSSFINLQVYTTLFTAILKRELSEIFITLYGILQQFCHVLHFWRNSFCLKKTKKKTKNNKNHKYFFLSLLVQKWIVRVILSNYIQSQES